MASEIRVNSLTNRSGLSTVTIADTGAVVAGIVTATTFSGPLTGAVTGNVTGDLTGNVTGNITGNVTGTATTATALSGSPSITVTDITATGNVSIGGTLTYEDVTNIDAVGIITAQSDVLVGRNLSVTSGISTVKSLDYAAIDSTISDTAVDVFIYDTSKDSDGGAWRKRTQHTSWYNETLGTVTRGTRKEFPAVAVIVIERQKIRIYDGDDPDLPMWMVFEINQYSNGGNLAYTPFGIGHVASSPYNSVSLSSVHMLNGLLFIGGNRDTNADSVHAAYDINFITEVMHEYLHYPTSATRASKWKLYGNISQRNSTDVGQYPSSRYKATGTDGGFSHVVNDVTMIVLPNAPIDDATRLPVPTIAVGTGVAGAANGGISIIKDDGSVVDITNSTGAGGYTSYNVEFGSNNELIHTQAYNDSYASVNIFDDIPSSDISASNSYSAARSYLYVNGVPDLRGGENGASTPNLEYVSKASNGDIAFGFQNTDAKLSLLSEPKGAGTVNQYSAVAYIASDYNTGWMIGDTKGAFLSDTDTTDSNADTLNSGNAFDGTFASSTGWTVDSDWSISGGVATCNGNNSGRFIYPTNDRWSYRRSVVVEITVTAYTSGTLSISYSTGGATSGTNMTATGTYKFVNVTTGNDLIYIRSDSFVGSIDNVKIYYAEEDRTGNKKGLITYGTITKSVVATGAELVAYSGFSGSNYLMQPYNSSLSAGTGSQTFMGWVYANTDSTLRYLFAIGEQDSNEQFRLGFSSSVVYFDYGTGSAYSQWNSTDAIPENKWTFVVATITAGQRPHIYIDGKLLTNTPAVNNAAPSTFLTATSYKMTIGVNSSLNANNAWNGSLSLIRYSHSAPSPEQIKKMYEDEKVLFQENAKATLYGSSDAVTGLAYDDDTDLLHVGTSSGRSDFQGLHRINNTTTAVTTAITAQNEFIIEQ